MAAGGDEKYVGLSVLIGTGLEYARIGMSGYEKKSRPIFHLSLPQVSELMADAIVCVNSLTHQQAKDLLCHDAMRVQLNLLMGLPGFMDMALDVLHANLKNGYPQNDQDIRSAAFAIIKGYPAHFQAIIVAFISQEQTHEYVSIQSKLVNQH